MKITCFIFVYSCIFYSFIIAEQKTKLLFVQILFRHGDRSPISLYPSDLNPESVWSEGLGKLTILGRQQQYAFGKYLRSMYQNFFTSNPFEIKVNSSEDDRCLESAQTNVAAFYAPKGKWLFEKTLNWQPIPIHYVQKSIDKYLETESDCPRATEEQQRIVNSAEGQKFIAEHKKMFEHLTNSSGNLISNWTVAAYLHDVLSIEKKYNLTFPSWAIPYWDELGYVCNVSFYWDFKSLLLHRLRAGPFLQNIIENMQRKINGDLPKLKFHLYSSHYTTIVAVLTSLNLYNMIKPPYCAALLFELHEDMNGTKVLRLLYQNSSAVEVEIQTPHVLILEGCSEFCPLEYFVKYTQHLMPGDWDVECQLDNPIRRKLAEQQIIMVCVLALIFMFILGLYALWKILKEKTNILSFAN